MSLTGTPSVMQQISFTPASAASRIASAANGGGTKIIVASRRRVHRLLDGVEDRQPVGVLLPALARGHAPHHLVP
jgi:hypothetical protein